MTMTANKVFSYFVFFGLIIFTNSSVEAKSKIAASTTANQEVVRIKVASVSLNQTVYDYARNVANILKAIDHAVKDNVDVLALQELCLTGYAADDYHQWNKNNETVWRQIQHIAAYAKAKNPNLIISVGAPWHYSDKKLLLLANDPLYNINNRPYNVQFVITHGRVVAMAAKSILADGPTEYEPRQFNAWPITKGTIMVKLPDGSEVPFGKPVVSFGALKKYATLFHEQCA